MKTIAIVGAGPTGIYAVAGMCFHDTVLRCQAAIDHDLAACDIEIPDANDAAGIQRGFHPLMSEIERVSRPYVIGGLAADEQRSDRHAALVYNRRDAQIEPAGLPDAAAKELYRLVAKPVAASQMAFVDDLAVEALRNRQDFKDRLTLCRLERIAEHLASRFVTHDDPLPADQNGHRRDGVQGGSDRRADFGRPMSYQPYGRGGPIN